MGESYTSARTDAIRTALLEANREHEHLETDLSGPIDIFQIICDAGIWLLFQPLESLYGMLVTDESKNVPGILLNSKHPPSLQRYTAAHEYGHYVLGHLYSFDGAVHIEGPHRNQRDLREVEAQVFAANFLMPLQLVNKVLKQLGLPLKPGELTARQAYQLAIQLGVSYPAAVHRLRDLGKITTTVHDQLLRPTRPAPREIKALIGRGNRPQNTRADVWELRSRDSGSSLWPHVDDELYMSLPEIPSSGWVWTLDTPDVLDLRGDSQPADVQEGKQLVLVRDAFESGAEPRTVDTSEAHDAQDQSYGAGGTHYFVFRALRPGNVRLRLVKKRPWMKTTTTNDLESFEIDLHIRPRPAGESAVGLAPQQRPALAEVA